MNNPGGSNETCLENFLDQQAEDVSAHWEAVEGVGLLLDGEYRDHHLRVLKHTAGYLLLVFCPLHSVKLDSAVGCGCPLADRLHCHTWQNYATARAAVEAATAVILSIRLRAEVRLEHSRRFPF